MAGQCFLCCILIVTRKETRKKIWIHHYISDFIVTIQREQPLQWLTAVQVVLFVTKVQIINCGVLWAAPSRLDAT